MSSRSNKKRKPTEVLDTGEKVRTALFHDERPFPKNFRSFVAPLDFDSFKDHMDSYAPEWKAYFTRELIIHEGLVREFYTALPQIDDNGGVEIRGKTVFITAQAINTLLKVPVPEVCPYDVARRAKWWNLDWDEIARGISSLPPRYEEIGEGRKMKYGRLDPNAKAIWQFITHSILITGHHSNLFRKHLYLLYCLMQRFQVNLGEILVSEIRAFFKPKTSRIPLPGLVTELCLHAGLKPQRGDKARPPSPPCFDAGALRKFLGLRTLKEVNDERWGSTEQERRERRDAARAHRRRLEANIDETEEGFEEENDEEDEPEREMERWINQEEWVAMNSRMDFMQEELGHIRGTQARMEANQATVMASQARMEANQAIAMASQARMEASHAAMMARFEAMYFQMPPPPPPP